MFSLALRKISETLQSTIYGAVFHGKDLNRGLLRCDEDPIAAMKNKEKIRGQVMDLRASYDHFLQSAESSSAPVSSYEATLRSTNPKLAAEAAAAKAQILRGTRSRAVTDSGEANRGGQKDAPKNRGGGKEPVGRAAAERAGGQNDRFQLNEPGSLTASWTWISQNELFISGLVWNVPELARKLGVPRNSRCWPWILTMRTAQNRPTVCDKWGAPGHRSESDAAHKEIAAFDRTSMSGDPRVCRLPTAEERQAQADKAAAAGIRISRPPPARQPAQDAQGRGRGQERGRGYGARGRARGGAQLPALWACPVA